MNADLLCPECAEDVPSTEVFEVFGMVLCAECAAHLFDQSEGLADDDYDWASPVDMGAQ